MAYAKSTWASGDLISAAKANNWETQYDEAYADATEFTTIYSEINRQTVIQGAVSSSDGTADFITGSVVALTAWATASTGESLILSFSAGNSTNGGANYHAQLTTTSSWTSLTENNTNFLYFDRSTAGVISQNQTIVPPQYGHYFNTTDNSLIHFDGAAGSTETTDNFENSWTNFGTAALSTAQFQFGTASLTLSGSSGSYVETTDITNLGSDGWTQEGWFYIDSTAANRTVISSVNTFGFNLLYNAVTGHLIPILAGSTTANSINSSDGSSGTIIVTSSAWHSWALTYNSSTYRLFLDGASDITIASTVILTSVLGGIRHGLNGATTTPLSGFIDEYRLSKGVSRYNAVYTPSTASFTGDVHFYDTNKSKMYFGDPTGWTEVQHLFVGEATTDASSVTDSVTYALKGETTIISGLLSSSQVQTLNHNLGIKPMEIELSLLCQTADVGYLPGDEVTNLPNFSDGTNSRTYQTYAERNTVKTFTGTNLLGIFNKTTGVGASITFFNSWKFKLKLKR